MKAQLCSLVRKLSQTVAIVNINEMYCRAPRVLLPCPTGPTTVPYGFYYRALQVLLASESKIAIPQYSYLFTHVHPLRYVGAFIHFGADGSDESAPTPTECTLRIIHVHPL